MRFFLTIVASFLGVLAAVVFLFLLLLAVVAAQDPTPNVAANTVLVLDLKGTLPETQPLDPLAQILSGRTVTLRDVTRALERAAADDRIAGVWLRPAGLTASWATASELHRALMTYRASGKPLIASPGDGGFGELSYYLATAADSIFSPPEAPFVMNGLFVATPFFGGTLDRLGVDPIVIRAGDYKGAAETVTERGYSPENRQQVADLLNTFDGVFRTAVADTRPITRSRLDALIAGGGIYTAHEAAGAGLLDGLRYEIDTETALRSLTRQRADEELRTISLRRYTRVPDREAGIRPGPRDRQIALVYANGVIMPGESTSDSAMGDLLGSETFVESIAEALRDDRTRALVIRVDSPGGSATASDAMWAAVRHAAERIPVIVSMGSVAASGGYYLAAPAHAIVADPATITGSIGVISVFFDATSFLDERLGITLDTLSTGPAAGLYTLGKSLSGLEQRLMEQETARIYTTFVDRVAVGRGLPADSVRALGGGRVYSGNDALAVGLVDELGDLEHAVRLAAQRADLEPGDYRLRVLPQPRPFIERLQESLGGGAATALARHHAPVGEELAVLRQAALLREAARLHATPQMRLLAVPEVR